MADHLSGITEKLSSKKWKVKLLINLGSIIRSTNALMTVY